jgi:hypothetical protein
VEVKDLLRSLFKYLWIILVGSVIAFLFFFFSIQNLKQTYLADATLMVIESKDGFSFNKLLSQQDVVLTIINNRKFIQRVCKLKNLPAPEKHEAFKVAIERNSKLLKLSFTGFNKESALLMLKGIIESIDPINEELELTSHKPLFVVLDEPSVNPVDIEKYKFNYLVINTLAVFFTLIAIVLLLAYIKHEKSTYVK